MSNSPETTFTVCYTYGLLASVTRGRSNRNTDYDTRIDRHTWDQFHDMVTYLSIRLVQREWRLTPYRCCRQLSRPPCNDTTTSHAHDWSQRSLLLLYTEAHMLHLIISSLLWAEIISASLGYSPVRVSAYLTRKPWRGYRLHVTR